MFWLEVLGWVGSGVLVYSLLQARVLRLRALNLVASVLLVTYNAVLGIWPMVAMNAAIAVINTWHLVRLARTRDDEATYEVVEVGPTEEYLRYLLRRHDTDIERHNPGFAWDGTAPGRSAFLVLRETETVGVVLLSHLGDTGDDPEGRVELDYVLPRFRDFTVGKFVYRREGLLSRLGFSVLRAPTDRMTDAADYFTRVGFGPDPAVPGGLVLDVGARRR